MYQAEPFLRAGIPFELVTLDVTNLETIQAMQDTLEKKNLYGPFNSVEEMMRDLDA